MKRRRKQNMEEKYITMNQALEEFFKAKRVENVSESTLATYRLHIKNFLSMKDMFDGELFTGLVCDLFYQDWVLGLRKDEQKRDTTVASYCRSVRAFLYWCMDKDYIPSYPLSIPKYQKTIKKCYSEEELTTLLEKPKNCTEVEYQTWVFINLVCATGLRLSSCLNLKVCDIVPRTKELYVQSTKNNQGLKLYLNEEVIKILNQYIKDFELFDEDYLFCTAEKVRLANRTMQDNVATYNRNRGIEKTSIHLFRHTYAKNYYNKTKDIYSLSQMLGHSDISITANYLKDLGLTVDACMAYNPQQLFIVDNKASDKRRRRGKLR